MGEAGGGPRANSAALQCPDCQVDIAGTHNHAAKCVTLRLLEVFECVGGGQLRFEQWKRDELRQILVGRGRLHTDRETSLFWRSSWRPCAPECGRSGSSCPFPSVGCMLEMPAHSWGTA